MTTWRCQRRIHGLKCAHDNPRTKRVCAMCGGPRPKRRVPAHRAILNELAYEQWVEQFGERCGICGRERPANRRLDRDHDHATGLPRGLLCHRCNRALPSWMTVDWLLAATAYLRRGSP